MINYISFQNSLLLRKQKINIEGIFISFIYAIYMYMFSDYKNAQTSLNSNTELFHIIHDFVKRSSVLIHLYLRSVKPQFICSRWRSLLAPKESEKKKEKKPVCLTRGLPLRF